MNLYSTFLISTIHFCIQIAKYYISLWNWPNRLLARMGILLKIRANKQNLQELSLAQINFFTSPVHWAS